MWTGLGFGAGRAWEECDSVSADKHSVHQQNRTPAERNTSTVTPAQRSRSRAWEMYTNEYRTDVYVELQARNGTFKERPADHASISATHGREMRQGRCSEGRHSETYACGKSRDSNRTSWTCGTTYWVARRQLVHTRCISRFRSAPDRRSHDTVWAISFYVVGTLDARLTAAQRFF